MKGLVEVRGEEDLEMVEMNERYNFIVKTLERFLGELYGRVREGNRKP